ncbi:MAG: hypothetical protein ACREJ3_06120 [Polyangiaceae bacterium]
MSAPSFDPTHAVRFDLARGTVRAGWPEAPVILAPSAALAELVRSAPAHAAEAFARAIGASLGARAASRMLDPKASSVEDFATQLAGEAALSGLGKLGVERWGRALVIVLAESTLADALVAPMIAAAIEASSGRKVECTLLQRDEHAARVLVSGEGGAKRVRQWIASGTAWGDALVKLHGGAS